MLKQQQKKSSLGGRKFTAKVISGGGIHKPAEASREEQSHTKMAVDYSTLMERSFGDSLHKHEEKPPTPSDPLMYLNPTDHSEGSTQSQRDPQ